MPWFRQRYFPHLEKLEKTPERLTASEARQRRIEAVLQKNLELQLRYGRLSPEDRISERIKPFSRYIDYGRERISSNVKTHGLQSAIQKASFDIGRTKNFRFLNLIGLKSRPQAPARKVGLEKPVAAASDRRYFHPLGKDAVPVTAYGTAAAFGYHAHQLLGMRALSLSARFAHPSKVIPCVQRLERREVMFARGKAGKGYKTPKRRGPLSGIIC